MAGPNTQTSRLPENQEHKWGKLSVAVATALLAFQMQVADAQNTTQVAMNAQAPAPTVSVKGGWQVVNIDGKEMTFAEIAGMDGAERRKNGILGKLKNLGQLEVYQKWSSGEIEAANQEGKNIDSRIQAANQEGKKLDLQLVTKYEEYISNIERWARGERVVVEHIARADITPVALKIRAQNILNNSSIRLAGL